MGLPQQFYTWWRKRPLTGEFGTSRENLELCVRIHKKYQNNIKESNRPNWIEYFLQQAEKAAERSIDAQTKCGCVWTDDNNHVIATGYNSYPPGMPDCILPNLRSTLENPHGKNEIEMINHAEITALCNITRPPHSILGGPVVYITQRPCLKCLSVLANCGVKKIYARNIPNPSKLCNFESDEYQLLLFSSQIVLDMVA